MANRVTTWSSGNTLTAATLNGEFNNVYTGTIDRTAGRWGTNDDIPLTLGSSQDAYLEWNTDQTNDLLMLGLGNTSRSLVVTEVADMATDYAHGNQTNPTIFVHSADATTIADWISLAHNQTDGVIDVGTGALSLCLAGTEAVEMTAQQLAIVGSTNPALRVAEAGDATSYLDIEDTSDNQCKFLKQSASGASNMDINPNPADGSSDALLRLGTGSTTTGTLELSIWEPDGLGTTKEHSLTADQAGAASNLCANTASTLQIGPTAVTSGAKVAINSTTLGFKLPVMSTAQKNAISSPDDGVLVYDSGLAKVCIRAGGAWETVTST